jgi:hypothetical protein
MLIVILASTSAVVVALGTLLYWFLHGEDDDTRSYDEYVGDIRAMNSYNSYFVGAIAIVIGLVVEGRDLPDAALILLLLAFGCGSGSMFFFPITRPIKSSNPSRTRVASHSKFPRNWWLSKIVLSQWTVVFSVFGICDVVVQAVF